jgi:hypothetical protein
MKTEKLLSCVLLFGIVSYAQAQQSFKPIKDSIKKEAALTPYDPIGNYETWAVKGKILPYAMGGGGGVNALLGLEFGFCKNQSLGIDAYLLTMGNHHDVFDPSKQEYVSTPAAGTNDKALFLNYRYYFSNRNLREKRGLELYAGSFLRYGYTIFVYEPGYPSNILAEHEMHYSGGPLIGVLKRFHNRLCVDLNLGAYYMEKDITTVTKPVNQEVTARNQVSEYGLRVGFNLYFWGYRKGPHTLQTL